MSTPVERSIRELLLAEIEVQKPKNQWGPTLQQGSILDAVAGRAGAGDHNPDLAEALLTQWYDLFRTGILSWGHNLSNPNPPFFHLTESGRRALANATSDPSNPAGYLRHLDSTAELDQIARSYLIEGLDCYVGGQFKAAAVMIGCAAESMLLDLRDAVVLKSGTLGLSIPRGMRDWKVKVVSDALDTFLNQHKRELPADLCAAFEATWSAFAFQIRTTRIDAGHPASVEDVTADTAHASLLVFPQLARLTNRLSRWIAEVLA
jgi:hypothetical protein